MNELVFGPAMWPTYHSLMRADFALFDEYKYQHAGKSIVHRPFALTALSSLHDCFSGCYPFTISQYKAS